MVLKFDAAKLIIPRDMIGCVDEDVHKRWSIMRFVVFGCQLILLCQMCMCVSNEQQAFSVGGPQIQAALHNQICSHII